MWTWTDDARAVFFTLGSGPDAEAAEARFLEDYAETKFGGVWRQRVPLDLVRGALDTLARSVPEAAHATPGWSPDKPLIALGQIGTNGNFVPDKNVPQFGLCLVGENEPALWLFARNASVAAFAKQTENHALDGRPPWPKHEKERCLLEQVYPGSRPWQPSAAVAHFLDWAAEQLRSAGRGPTVHDVQQARAALGHDDLPDCLYPQLVEQLRRPGTPRAASSKPTKRRADAGHKSVEPASQPTAEAADDSQDWLGAVYRVHAGQPKVHVAVRCCFETWFHSPQNGREILCLVAGAGQQDVQRATDAIHQAEAVWGNPAHLTSSPVTAAGAYYVYLYFKRGIIDWRRVFYIGKGIDRRDGAHVAEVAQLQTAGQPLVGTKQRRIAQALRCGAGAKLYRRVFAFNPARPADDLAEDLAFCAEYYLITARYGAYNVANETNGNARSRRSRLRLLARPFAFDGTLQHHRQWWDAACGAFVQHAPLTGPIIPARHMACLRLMALEPIVAAFDRRHARRGLGGLIKPVAANTNSSPLVGHLQVSNTQDATVNYHVVGRLDPAGKVVPAAPPFRLELVASRTTPGIRINLRPSAGTAAFIAHLQQRLAALGVSPLYANGIVANAKNAPFFKPFAPVIHGRPDGDHDVTFEFVPPYGTSRSELPPRLQPHASPHWPAWDPHGAPALSVADAIRAVLRYLA